MTSIGTGYDVSAMTYSPDGKVFQVEYALKAVENSGTAIALRVKDGVVIAVEKIVTSKMLEEGSNSRINAVDLHIAMGIAGLLADGRHLLNKSRSEAQNYQQFYNTPIPVKVLAERMALYMQFYTLYSHVRPFGCSVIFAGIDSSGPQLYMVEPSGVCYGYFGVAIGKARTSAHTEIEKLSSKLNEMSCREAVQQAAKIIYQVHDELKDRLFELELGWVCAESNHKYERVPKELKEQAEAAAKLALEETNK
jgi:20S proteasome subunit alpha 7